MRPYRCTISFVGRYESPPRVARRPAAARPFQAPHNTNAPEAGLRGVRALTRMDRTQAASVASSSSATMFVILIIGLTAGPAVSL